jgi:hypothetical protein
VALGENSIGDEGAGHFSEALKVGILIDFSQPNLCSLFSPNLVFLNSASVVHLYFFVEGQEHEDFKPF